MALAQISDPYSDYLFTAVNSVSNGSLCKSPESLPFYCRGQSPFKQKFQSVHIALEGVEDIIGFECLHILYSLPLV